jgi:uncharacterized protein YndB with AHSA1/START domain
MERHAKGLALILAGLAMLGVREAHGEVLEATPGGFSVKTTVSIAAPRARVYDALVQAVGRWWDPEHTYSGDAANLSIDPRPGGCFCEKLAQQGAVQHGMVVLAIPAKTLRLSGAIGPLQESGVAGSLTFDLAEREGATDVAMTYSVGGYRQGGLQTLAPLVDTVLGTQLRRLKDFVEKGTPAPSPTP